MALSTAARNPTTVGLQVAVVTAVNRRACHPAECTPNPKPSKIQPSSHNSISPLSPTHHWYKYLYHWVKYLYHWVEYLYHWYKYVVQIYLYQLEVGGG